MVPTPISEPASGEMSDTVDAASSGADDPAVYSVTAADAAAFLEPPGDGDGEGDDANAGGSAGAGAAGGGGDDDDDDDMFGNMD